MHIKKWWIDRGGNDFICTRGTKEVPDDLHWGKAEELWECTTHEALGRGMVRLVRYDSNIEYQHHAPINRRQLSTLSDIAIEESCSLVRV